MGKNANGTNVHIYYQMCPSCKEPIVALKEFAWDDLKALSFNEEGLIFLKKDKK